MWTLHLLTQNICQKINHSVIDDEIGNYELDQLVQGVDVYPDHLGSSPHRGKFGSLFSY